VKVSVMRISIPFDLSSRSFIPLPRFIRSRLPTPLLAPSLVLFPLCSALVVHAGCLFYSFIGLSTHQSFSVTFFTFGFRPFYSAANKNISLSENLALTLSLNNKPPEESDQFRFLRAASLANLKGSVGLILAKASTMWISIPLDLSSRSFLTLPLFIRSRRPTPLLALPSSFFLRVLPNRHMLGVSLRVSSAFLLIIVLA